MSHLVDNDLLSPHLICILCSTPTAQWLTLLYSPLNSFLSPPPRSHSLHDLPLDVRAFTRKGKLCPRSRFDPTTLPCAPFPAEHAPVIETTTLCRFPLSPLALAASSFGRQNLDNIAARLAVSCLVFLLYVYPLSHHFSLSYSTLYTTSILFVPTDYSPHCHILFSKHCHIPCDSITLRRLTHS